MKYLCSPCELVVWYVLPTIRSELSKDLIKMGLSQKDVSQRLGITEAAVSQYKKGKRGKGIELKGEARKAVTRLAEDVAKDRTFSDFIFRICKICAKLKIDRTLCGPHKEYTLVPKRCDACIRLKG